jgi:hypothetical protein
MAKFGPFKNGYLQINGVDLSDHVEAMTLNVGAATLDNSAMGDNYDNQRAGLLNWSVEATFFQDFAASSVDATLYPLFSAGTSFALVMRPDSGGVSTGNPQWSGDAFISSYTPVGGTHGDNLMSPVTFSPATDLVRATT